ncbi:MAG: xylan 1,4-beta-xylosidase [Clostridia bacterium]|nr:xylan 1,4-beta-xylosidase [Clostridia bacterium]
MAKDKRFEKVYKQNMGEIEIWVDRETGVNYLYRQSGYSGGLTVLLDKDGKPVITPFEENHI